jgi:lamin tail-like protein
MTEYRWERAMGGALADGAPPQGHGWEWRDTDDGGQERSPLWLVRSLPQADGSVRLGFLRRGDGAYLGGGREAPRLDEYEVLLDEGEWAMGVWGSDDNDEWLDVGASGVVCGRLADGTPLYAMLRDREGEGEDPGEASARMGISNSKFLVAPVEAAAAPDSSSAASGGAPSAEEPVEGGAPRWAKASEGEVPREACAKGHGWEYETPGDSDTPQVPLWVMRTIAGTEPFAEEVRVGRVRRGGPATVGGWRSATPVTEYEVLLDEGAWEWMDSRFENEDDEDSGYYAVAAGAVACGRRSDGSALYAAIEYRDDEMGGAIPSETGERAERNWERKVLVDPVAAQAAGSAPPLAPAAPAPPAPAKLEVALLDLKGELVVIANAGATTIDIGGWRLRDDSKGKPYVFPAGTVVAAGGHVGVRSGPNAAKPEPGELAWKTTSVWNDRGDTAFLEDPSGTVVSTKKG